MNTSSYLFRLEDDIKFDDSINESSGDKTLYPVYVVLMHTGTSLSTAIKKVTNSSFSHSSISFDSSLHNMYTFGRKADVNPFVGGFKKEDIRDDFFQSKDILYSLYIVPSTMDEIARMKKRLDYFIQNSSKFKYDFTGLFKNYLGITDNPEYKWFCSRFVADILNAGRPVSRPYVKDPFLQKPQDFVNDKFAHYVTGGTFKLYNQRQVDKIVGMMMDEFNNKIKTESCKSISDARKFVTDVDRLAKKYNANYFIVTDGASGIHNDGNEAVRAARVAHTKWENKNGFDPNEDWSMNESIEYYLGTHPKSKDGYVTLYHASINNNLDVIVPVSLNAGTNFSKPRSSSFWSSRPDVCITMAIISALRETLDDSGKKLTKSIDYFINLAEGKATFKESSKDVILKAVNKYPITLYAASIPVKYIGKGHNIELNEFTVDIPVKPFKKVTVNKSTLNSDYMRFIPDSDYDEYKIEVIKKMPHNIAFRDKIVYKPSKYHNEYMKAIKKYAKTAHVDDSIDFSMYETVNKFDDVMDIVNKIPRDEHKLFYHGDSFKDSPYVVYRSVINNSNGGAFIDVYSLDDPNTGIVVIASTPDSRGTGITDKLVQDAIHNSPKNIKTLYWKCAKTNSHSFDLATRNGFILDSRETTKDEYVLKYKRNLSRIVSESYSVSDILLSSTLEYATFDDCKTDTYLKRYKCLKNNEDWLFKDPALSTKPTPKGFIVLDKSADAIAGYGFVTNNNLIFSVYVFPKYRHRGIATNVVKKLMSEYGATTLEVTTDNKHAIDLYSKLGFKIIGKTKTFGENNEKDTPAYVMSISNRFSSYCKEDTMEDYDEFMEGFFDKEKREARKEARDKKKDEKLKAKEKELAERNKEKKDRENAEKDPRVMNVSKPKESLVRKIQNKALDADVKFRRKLSEKRKAAKEAKNAGKAVAKIPLSIKGMVDKAMHEWDEADDNRRKEYIIKPGVRKKYWKALKLAILHFGAFAINPILNVVLLISHKLSNSKDIRIRNELVRELKAEIKVTDEKIKDADYARDKDAKYKLMRIREKLDAELTRVTSNSKFI